MKNKYNLLVALCLIITSTAFSQDLVKDSIRVQKIIKDAGKGKKGEKLLTVTDAASVAFLSSYIDARAKAVGEMEQMLAANSDKALGRRYRKGDTSVKPQVLDILKSKDNDKISGLLDELAPGYFDKDKTVTLDADVRTEIFKLLDNNELESNVVQFAGYNKIEGHVPAFEARLLSGKSMANTRLFYWLGRDGKSMKAVDYFISSFGKIPLNDEDGIYWFTDGLEEFMEHGTEPVKKKIIDFSIAYMDKNPITMADLLRIGAAEENGEYLADFEPKTYFIQLVLKSDDARVPAFSAKVEATMVKFIPTRERKELHDAMELNLLRFYDFPKKKAAALESQAVQDDFIDFVSAVAKDKALLNDKEVAVHLMKLFEKNGFTKEHEAELFAAWLKNMDKPVFDAASVFIKSAGLRTMVSEYYALEKKTLADNNDYLIKNGLIAAPVTREQLNKRKEDEDLFFVADDSIYEILEISGISINFDVEPGIYPADHDTLLLEFAKKSKGKINGLKAYQQSHYNDNDETSEIHLIAVYNNKAYIMIPEDLGDWYDMETFSILLDAILKDSGSTERFVPLNTGDQTAWYIFGDGEKVGRLARDYKLENTESIGDQE